MATRILPTAAAASMITRPFVARTLHTSSRLANVAAAAPLPARRPVGAFRGGLFGFLFGSTLAGSGVYYYVFQEYKASNELLTEDIYALQNAITQVAKHLTSVEDKVDLMEKKKR